MLQIKGGNSRHGGIYFNSGYPGVSKELLATASDISFCL